MGNVCSISVPCDAITSRCLDCTARKATYISQLEDNVVALQTAMQNLIEARNDVMRRVTVAEQQQMIRLNQVQLWLSRVQQMETTVGDLIINDSSQETDKLCFGGFCSKDCKSSYKFGKKVSKMIKDVTTLMAEGANFQEVAERVPEAAVDELPHEPMLVGLESTLDTVWRCLAQEDQVGIIGLYGMGGVGKTTLLTQINNKFVDTPNDFDIVIWVVVSKDLQLEKIQENIAQRIGLCNESWKNKSLQEKAGDIFKILSKKKFVLLLDDIWERVDLTKIGVPLATPKNIASKVVFTTRFVDICGLMESNRKFKVKCLTDGEAWKLFQNKVGEETLNSHPDILELAKSVAQECGGLPLALITIGRAMAYKKTPEEWNYAIQVLKRSASDFPGMGKEVYPLLKFSYDSLSDDRIRSCLLYCSLFSEDHYILESCLIDCWIGEGIFDENDYNQVQNKGYYIIGVLLHACLLEEGGGSNYVKMHDVIRDMALWITCEIEKENVLIQAGAGLTEAPKIGKWVGVTRVSLMDNEIEDLLEFSTCSHLTTLFLQSNSLRTINSYFFQFMPSLKVLNLSSNYCLNEFPPGISKLVSLQYLNLSMTGIRELPIELKALVNLKCLNLEEMSCLCTIPRQLISSFSMLQVLRMVSYYSSEDYSAQDNVLFGGHEFLVEELLCLKYINVLTITLKSSDALGRFLSSRKLRRCTKSLSLQEFSDSKSLNVLSLAGMKHLHSLHLTSPYLEELKIGGAQEVQSIRETHGFRSLHTFRVNFCGKLRDLTWLVFAQNLKFLFVANCLLMEEIISAREIGQVPEMMGNLNPFGKLEFLQLKDLQHLKSIYCNALPFLRLKDITVLRCRNLKKLPLDSNSTKERKIVIKGEEGWWKELQWEDEATQNAFLPCFKSHSSS
ncbi:hypothetical protein EZV62_004135 [Acer yangbiense]|uniref:Uncharacterized protein n=1 Tax=Acer yangbiense TaxID=1000413 RepID=A0A5C7IIU7_9ROSI|nr:hypothetical protein EZV62_004135 [Acer yangbiense]